MLRAPLVDWSFETRKQVQEPLVWKVERLPTKVGSNGREAKTVKLEGFDQDVEPFLHAA